MKKKKKSKKKTKMEAKKKAKKARVYLVETTVAYSVLNCGDGSAYPIWFLNMKDADFHNVNQLDGWGETCTGTVETFVGSDIHGDATENSGNLCKKCGDCDDYGCECDEEA